MAHILLVSTNADRAAEMMSLLEAGGHNVTLATDFQIAIGALARHAPDLLISDVRLGAFNGLHLALRCQNDHPTTSVMLLDTVDDWITRAEARRCRATYLVEPFDDAELLVHVSRALVAMQAPRRRWPRKRPTIGLAAHVARRPGRMTDLSYGGFRIEVPGLDEIQPRFEVALPSFGVALLAKLVWTWQAPSGSFWCGAELSDPDPQSAVVWRHIVDSVATQA